MTGNTIFKLWLTARFGFLSEEGNHFPELHNQCYVSNITAGSGEIIVTPYGESKSGNLQNTLDWYWDGYSDHWLSNNTLKLILFKWNSTDSGAHRRERIKLIKLLSFTRPPTHLYWIWTVLLSNFCMQSYMFFTRW